MSHGDADSSRGEPPRVWCIVVAGGAGLRFGSRKQFADLGGRSVLQRSIDAATTASAGVVVVVPEDVSSVVEAEVTIAPGRQLVVVSGGDTRAGSVRAGLAAVPVTADLVMVHDAARPLATADLFTRVIGALEAGAVAVVPVVAVTDTIRHRDRGVVDRDQLLAVQTPQGFRAAALRDAHDSGSDATDDATLVEARGHEITFVDGEASNRKLTDPSDLSAAVAIINQLEERT